MYNCPVCITGDFNTFDFDPELEKTTTIPTPSIAATDYSYMLADGSVKDAKFYTDILVNDIGSVHGFGAAAYARNYSFDHVFCTSDTTVRQFYTACDNHQQYASDHAWLIVDVDLSTKKFFAFDE